MADQLRLVHVAMPPDVPELGTLRAWITEILPGLTWDAISDLQLAATELVTNAYDHGRPPIEFTLYALPGDGLRIEVSDSWAALPQRRSSGHRMPHGRGLAIVEALATRWGVTSRGSGKTVWAEFKP